MVYGREACGLCKATRNNLDNARIAYTYYDIDADQTKKSEMWHKINIAHPASVGGVRLPVVDIDGKILISPSFNEVKKHLRWMPDSR